MNISTLTYLPTIHILTSKINFWKSEFWDHLAKPLGCPLGICILLVLLLQAKCYVCLSLYNNWILAKGKKCVKYFFLAFLALQIYFSTTYVLRWRSKASKWWLHFLCMFKPSFLDLLFWILCQFQNIWKCRWLWSHQISRIMLYPISKMSQTRSRYYYILFTYREMWLLLLRNFVKLYSFQKYYYVYICILFWRIFSYNQGCRPFCTMIGFLTPPNAKCKQFKDECGCDRGYLCVE